MADEPDLVADGRRNHPDWVGFLQQTLAYWGYRSGERDGSFGDALDDAVRTFQTDNGLLADGWVGRRTWAVLQREAVVIDVATFPTLFELAESNGDPGCWDDTGADIESGVGCEVGEVGAAGPYATACGQIGALLAASMADGARDGGQPIGVSSLGRVVHAGRAAVEAGRSQADRLERSGRSDASAWRVEVERLRSEIDRLHELIGTC